MFAVVMVIYLLMIFFVQHWTVFHYLFMTILLGFWVMVAMFFRIPRRIFTEDGQRLIAPADGVIVTIEETMEKEYIKEECFHRGNYFVASYPKSSVLNERTSVGLRLPDGQKIMIRQIAGTMARRIVCYAREGEQVKQNQEMGFIKFGSRIDLFVPKHFTIDVDLQDVVKNAISPICTITSPTE